MTREMLPRSPAGRLRRGGGARSTPPPAAPEWHEILITEGEARLLVAGSALGLVALLGIGFPNLDDALHGMVNIDCSYEPVQRSVGSHGLLVEVLVAAGLGNTIDEELAAVITMVRCSD